MKKFNGDIRIENDIWEALTKYRIPGEQMQCLLFIIRQTIGWNKEKNNISFSKFVEATGINKGNVGRALRGLIEKKVVVKKDNNRGTSYCFNKKYSVWKSLSKKTTVVKKDNSSCQKRQQSLSKKTPPPYINNKHLLKTSVDSDELKREREKETEVYLEKNKKSYQKARLLFNHIKKRDNKIKEPNWKEWTIHIERLHKIDGRDFSEIKDVVNWCQQDDFWQNNILSTAKLRKQFTQLRLKMNNKPKISTRHIPEENSRGKNSFGKKNKSISV